MSTDFAVQKDAILGRFARETKYMLEWFPEFVEEFPKALDKVPQPLVWDSCKFIAAAKSTVPDKFGVYCFAIELGDPFPKKVHVPLYIGKATDQYLSERYDDYLKEKKNYRGREKVVVMLNKYQNRLTFWWSVVPKVYVDVVEQHLLMCCKPPCNTRIPNREKFWAKAFV
jgi:hypothetical protein